MASMLTDEQRKYYEEILSKAEPYTEKELAEQEYDAPLGTYDYDRMKATFAKKVLEGEI